MFHTSHDGIVLFKIIPLVTFYHGLCDLITEIRILTTTFCNAAPAGIPGDVYHRGKGPANAVGTRFACRNSCTLFYFLHIPAARQSKWNWEHGLVPVDHVHSKDQRYFQATLPDRHLLYIPDLGYRFNIKQPTDLSFTYFFSNI